MASVLQIYSLCTVMVDGVTLFEEATVSVRRMTGNIDQDTVQKDFAGISPGARKMEVRVESAVPAADFELNPGKYMNTNKVMELTLFCAGRTLTSKGFVKDDEATHGVNQAAKSLWNGTFQYADWV